MSRELWINEPSQTTEVAHNRMNQDLEAPGTLVLISEVPWRPSSKVKRSPKRDVLKHGPSHLALSSPYSISVNSLPSGGKHSLSVRKADILLEMDGGMKGELYLQIKVEWKRPSGEILFGRGCGHSSNVFKKIKILHPPKKPTTNWMF